MGRRFKNPNFRHSIDHKILMRSVPLFQKNLFRRVFIVDQEKFSLLENFMYRVFYSMYDKEYDHLSLDLPYQKVNMCDLD